MNLYILILHFITLLNFLLSLLGLEVNFLLWWVDGTLPMVQWYPRAILTLYSRVSMWD